MDRIARILDANVNRAAEAARVVEDYARFVAEDPDAARLARGLRHRVAALGRSLGVGRLAARDSAGDIGREPRSGPRRPYGDAAEALAANLARLGEALRSIEEWSRLGHLSRSRAAGAARFEVYGLATRLLAAADPRRRLARARLCVLLTSGRPAGPLERVAAAALEGGADMLRLCEKGLSDRALAALGRRLARLAHRHGALLLLGSRSDVAAACGADGVHLAAEDLPIPAARRLLGPAAVIGATARSVREARAALAAGADYVSIGPVFPEAAKPGLVPEGLRRVRVAARSLDAPFFATGGITPGNAAQVVRAGADRIAVCAAVMGARRPAAVARRLKRIVAGGGRWRRQA